MAKQGTNGRAEAVAKFAAGAPENEIERSAMSERVAAARPLLEKWLRGRVAEPWWTATQDELDSIITAILASSAQVDSRVSLLAHFLECYFDEIPTGDTEFDVSYDMREQARIILKRLDNVS